MCSTFKIINARNIEDTKLLASMHNLRFEVFCEELKWKAGLRIINRMEFDEYDREDTIYIVRVNEDNEVDATCRLISTETSYMIRDHYSHFIDKIPMPKSKSVWELSRFCISRKARRSLTDKPLGQLIAAAIEFGLLNNIQNYVALATDSVIPVIRRVGGWDPTPLGEKMATPEDHSCSVIYTVSQDMLEKIKRKSGITNSPLMGSLKYSISEDFHVAA